MKKIFSILVFSFLLSACVQTSVKVEPEKYSETASTETRPTLIPEGCMTWFDGCNECIVENQKIVGCTKKACAQNKKPECRVMVKETNEVPWETLEVTVGPEKVDCVGVAPMKCLVVDGKYFYDKIADFEHEAGYDYRLKIERYQIFTPETAPADASLYSYQLVEVLEKEKAE